MKHILLLSGNGNDVNLMKLYWKNLCNHIKGTYFWLVLAIWYHCETGGKAAKALAGILDKWKKIPRKENLSNVLWDF